MNLYKTTYLITFLPILPKLSYLMNKGFGLRGLRFIQQLRKGGSKMFITTLILLYFIV